MEFCVLTFGFYLHLSSGLLLLLLLLLGLHALDELRNCKSLTFSLLPYLIAKVLHLLFGWW